MAEHDKLNKAFREMRKRGLLAYQSFMCCTTCGGAEIANKISKLLEDGKRTKESITGCCFYHKQATERRDRGDSFMLQYGPVGVSGIEDDVGLPTEDVGKIVCECLKEAEVEYRWDGDPNRCVEVVAW